MQYHVNAMTNFLVHQKVLNIGSLISTQLDNISHFGILLHGSVTTKILLEGFANALDVQIFGQSSDGGNTFSSVTLLDPHVHLFFRGRSALVSGIVECVCCCYLFVNECKCR